MSENIFIYQSEINRESFSHFELFKMLNSTKFGTHSANKMYEDNDGNIIAVRCNCGKKIYHRIFSTKVNWEVDVHGKDFMVYSQRRPLLLFEYD